MPKSPSPSWSIPAAASIRRSMSTGRLRGDVARRGFASDPQKITVTAGRDRESRLRAQGRRSGAQGRHQRSLDRGRLSGPSDHHRQGRRVLHRLRQGLSARSRPRRARAGVHVLPWGELLRGAAARSRRLGRRHQHDEQARGRRGTSVPPGKMSPKDRQLLLDYLAANMGPKRRSARSPSTTTCRSTSTALGKAMYVEYEMPKFGPNGASDRAEPVFRP